MLGLGISLLEISLPPSLPPIEMFFSEDNTSCDHMILVVHVNYASRTQKKMLYKFNLDARCSFSFPLPALTHNYGLMPVYIYIYYIGA